MSLRLIVRPEAEEDTFRTAEWYEKRETGLGYEFTHEIGAAIQRARKNPTLFPLLRIKPEVRRIPAHRFHYRIFFILRPDALIVFVVLHAARHDSRWQSRV